VRCLGGPPPPLLGRERESREEREPGGEPERRRVGGVGREGIKKSVWAMKERYEGV
jgi:hypothetical protein